MQVAPGLVVNMVDMYPETVASKFKYQKGGSRQGQLRKRLSRCSVSAVRWYRVSGHRSRFLGDPSCNLTSTALNQWLEVDEPI